MTIENLVGLLGSVGGIWDGGACFYAPWITKRQLCVTKEQHGWARRDRAAAARVGAWCREMVAFLREQGGSSRAAPEYEEYARWGLANGHFVGCAPSVDAQLAVWPRR